jgi:DNA-binding CsgD family transcriptional regulator
MVNEICRMTRATVTPLGHTNSYEVVTLSRREAQVLYWVMQALRAKEIAQRLDLEVSTVKHYVEKLYSDLGLDGWHALQRWGSTHFSALTLDPVPPLDHPADCSCPAIWCSAMRHASHRLFHNQSPGL